MSLFDSSVHDQFDGDVLNIIALPDNSTTVFIPILVPHDYILNCYDISTDIRSGVLRKEVMLHAEMKENEYLSPKYFSKLDSFIASAIAKEVNNHNVCGLITGITLCGDPQHTTPYLLVMIDKDDMPYGKKLIRIMEHSNVFAVPIVSSSMTYMGYYGDKFNNLYRPTDTRCTHFALCLGRVNDTFLII